jgi:hypothetical protein
VTERALAGGEAAVELELPADARETTPHAADVSAVPGARLTWQKAWTSRDTEVEIVCAAASARLWLDGLEGPVLHGATSLVRAQAGLGDVRAGPVEPVGGGFGQRFSGGAAGGEVAGRHLLGFADAGRLAFVCTTACRGRACDDVLGSMRFAGEVSAPPAPGALVRALVAAAQHPTTSVAAAASLAVALVTLVLWRRPRPRW